MHADKEPEPLNLGVPVVNFPRANAILARAQALLWVRDWGVSEIKYIIFIEKSDYPYENYNNYIKLSIVFHPMIIVFRK